MLYKWFVFAGYSLGVIAVILVAPDEGHDDGEGWNHPSQTVKMADCKTLLRRFVSQVTSGENNVAEKPGEGSEAGEVHPNSHHGANSLKINSLVVTRAYKCQKYIQTATIE